MSNTNEDVQIIHRKNRLKEKVSIGGAGAPPRAGFIDPEAIKRAQAVIDNGAESYRLEMERTLKNLGTAWKSLLSEEDVNSKSYQGKINDIHRFANHIKDIAGTFGFELMDYFACSLRDFSEYIDIRVDAHIKIVEAHINVMNIAFHENIKTAEGKQAQELKAIVSQAIQKFSKGAI